MKTLTLSLKKPWFDMIKSGEKKEEYREIKPYYTSRLTIQASDDYDLILSGEISANFQYFDKLVFTLGYPKADDDELSRLKARIAELEKENQTLAEDVSDKIESITELMELVEKYKSEKAELEEERRWRKFSEEKPNEKQWILVFVENPSRYGTYIELRRWDMGCKFDVEDQELYTHWMPLPSAPKEDK